MADRVSPPPGYPIRALRRRLPSEGNFPRVRGFIADGHPPGACQAAFVAANYRHATLHSKLTERRQSNPNDLKRLRPIARPKNATVPIFRSTLMRVAPLDAAYRVTDRGIAPGVLGASGDVLPVNGERRKRHRRMEIRTDEASLLVRGRSAF